MSPTVFFPVPSFPYNSSGKLDLLKLVSQRKHYQPEERLTDPVEQMLLNEAQFLMPHVHLTTNTNWLESGMDSLLLVVFQGKIAEEYGDIKLHDLVHFPTVSKLTSIEIRLCERF